jgi:hypothetical protein
MEAAVFSETLTRKVHGLTSLTSSDLVLLLIPAVGDMSVLSQLVLKSILEGKNAYVNCVYAKLYSYSLFWY